MAVTGTSNKSRKASNAYMREYMRLRYYQRQAKAVELLGGKCANCGSKQNLQFDHKDPSTKNFVICRRLATVAAQKLAIELTKCQLLCDSCHQAKSIADLGKRPAKGRHGTISSYRYCRCAACRKAKSFYNRRAA